MPLDINRCRLDEYFNQRTAYMRREGQKNLAGSEVHRPVMHNEAKRYNPSPLRPARRSDRDPPPPRRFCPPAGPRRGHGTFECEVNYQKRSEP